LRQAPETEVGAWRRRRWRFNVGGVLDLNNPPALVCPGGSGPAVVLWYTVKKAFSVALGMDTMRRTEQQGRSEQELELRAKHDAIMLNSVTRARRRREINFNRVLVRNEHGGGGGGYSPSVECLFSIAPRSSRGAEEAY